MNDTYTANVGRTDFRLWVLVIKDGKVINRSLAGNKYRVKHHIACFEEKYKDVEGVAFGLCYVDEFDYDTNSVKVTV